MRESGRFEWGEEAGSLELAAGGSSSAWSEVWAGSCGMGDAGQGGNRESFQSQIVRACGLPRLVTGSLDKYSNSLTSRILRGLLGLKERS